MGTKNSISTGSGHFIIAEKPKELTSLLDRFYDGD